MDRELLRAGAIAALIAALLVAAPGRGDEPPPMNQFHGTVVLAEDGGPAAGVPVVMAHGDKGYIYFAETGLHGGGEDEKVLWFFVKRNSKHFCVTMTDSAGRFTLMNFAAPDELWIVAAGDPERGYALQTNVQPQEYADKPLRIEIGQPAFITTVPPSPPKKSLQVYVSAALAPAPPSPAAEEGADTEAEDVAERVYFFSPDLAGGSGKKPIRIGPLPGGQTYRVTASVWGRSVPYPATIFERTVDLAAGGTAEVSLESREGVTLSGKVTSSKDEPLANVNVMVKAVSGLVIGALTGDDGKYKLRGLPPGSHQLKLLRHAKRRTPG